MVQTLVQLSVHLSRFREAAAVTAQDNCKQKVTKKKLMHVAKCLQASLRAGREKSAKQCARLKSWQWSSSWQNNGRARSDYEAAQKGDRTPEGAYRIKDALLSGTALI